MLEQYIISDIKQLKALSHSSRVKILSALADKAMTAKQLADQFGEEPAKTSYHVKQLLKVGLVELVFTRETQNGIIEKYYRAIAREFQTDPYLARQPEGRTHLEAGFLRTLNKTQSDFLRAYRNDLERNQAAAAEGEAVSSRTSFDFHTLHTTPEKVQEFLEELRKLAAKLMDTNGAGNTEYTFHYLVFPVDAEDEDVSTSA